MKYIRNVLVTILIGMLALPAGALAASAKVTSSSAKIYRSSSTSSASVALKKGASVSVTSVSGKWAKISYKGVTGYVPAKYLSNSSASDTAKSGGYKAYICKKTYVYKKPSASSKKKSIGVNTKICVVGQSGSYFKVQKSGSSVCGYVLKSCVSENKVSETAAAESGSPSWKSKVVTMNWFKGGSSVLATGGYAYIYDIDTGITMRIKRMGGHNHADVEPATATDTAKLRRIAGGTFSWDSHAVILKAGGKYVACAINTMPHGDQTITNNGYEGQFCLHMTGSTTHSNDATNANHQEAIKKAYNWAH